MNRTALFAALFLIGAGVTAHAAPQASAVSRRYHEARVALTIPPYSLQKVRSIIRGIKRDHEGNRRLSPAAFNRLTVEERFTYVMLHGEDYDQNCDISPVILHEERKIFPYVPSAFDDAAAWSRQQTAFLKNNRARVIALMRETLRRQGRVGSNFKEAITELNAVELIPDLSAVYRRTRSDHDILSVLMLLMKEGNYRPFLNSSIHKKLFGENADFLVSIPASPANQKFILDQAAAFHRSRKA